MSSSKWSRLLDVYDEIECDHYWDDLRQPGIRLVRGDSSETAEFTKVLVVGEAPGARENGEGRPFVGPSGSVLNDLMGLAGLARGTAFVTNVVKYRPPGNRTPSLHESFHAQTALRAEWSIIRPLLTLLIGSTAHNVMHPNRGLMSIGACLAGRSPFRYSTHDGEKHLVMSMYHPAYGLRNRKMQPRMEDHWEELGDWLREFEPGVFHVEAPEA